MDIFEEDESIPVRFLVDPLVQTIRTQQNITYFLSGVDFEFFNAISKHPHLKINTIIQMFDLLIHVYLTDIVFAPLAAGPLMNLINLYIDMDEV